MNTDCFDCIEIPVLPLRDVVVYPYMVIPLFIGREKSIRSLEIAMSSDKKIILVAQKESMINEPSINDLFLIGTVSYILQMIKLPDGTVKVLIEGLTRARVVEVIDVGEYFLASVNYIKSIMSNDYEEKALIRISIDQFEEYVKLNKRISSEVFVSLNNIDSADKLGDIIAAHMPLKLVDKQLLLEMIDVIKRLEKLMVIMSSEIDLLKIEKRIRERVKNQMEKSQREYYLNEQMKAIQKELGGSTGRGVEEVIDDNNDLKKKIESTKMPKDVRVKVKLEFYKLKMMSPISAEATVVRSYIDWILSVPWRFKSKIKKNLCKAKQILNNDHYGLEKIKERILEYLAVQNRISKVRGGILCFVGPPGVGKTSLGRSIAKATGRKYIRMALGGLKDEAEIRGHRRTYIGSMPGRIIQKISKVGVKNPLFLLDEIDKISFDVRGDPSSALLEVLDPEQNVSFSDHYLEVDYDLSDVMFIATANSTSSISPALLDRMEVIRLSGYTENEKLNISRNYLLGKQFARNALKEKELIIDNIVLLDIIRYYTKEAGVRNLEREIAALCRKTVKLLLINKNVDSVIITSSNLKDFLGVKKFDYDYSVNNVVKVKNNVGQVIALAWTEFGGDLITIESSCVFGKGKLIYTGSLGNIMKESIQAALTVVRSRSVELGLNDNFYESIDVHVHIPEGSIPKDGPSAGIAVCTSLVSSFTNNPIKKSVAMTGEITLCGRVLAIGGLKEKLLAAHRGGVKTVLIPLGNKCNLEDIPSVVKNDLNIHLVNHIDDVFSLSLQNFPFNKLIK